MTSTVHYGSDVTTWQTPALLFDELNDIFNFTIDVAANENNHMLPNFLTEESNFLTTTLHGETAWMNPPYGGGEKKCKPNCKLKKCETRGYHAPKDIPGISDFIDRAAFLSVANSFVCLVPARTETKWFRTCWSQADAMLFFYGRLTFQGAKSGAPFPSCLIFFGRGLSKNETGKLSKLGKIVLL